MSDNLLDVNRIQKILPHRYPFLLVDRVLDYKVGEFVSTLKNVTVNEPCFPGHFPNRPVFPGVLTLEALAQSAAILASLGSDEENHENLIFLFAGIDKARFKRPITPGDQLHMTVQMLQQKRQIWRCHCEGKVDGELAVAADVIFTYRIIED